MEKEKAYEVTIDELGRVVLPIAIRKELGLDIGTPMQALLYEADGEVLVKITS